MLVEFENKVAGFIQSNGLFGPAAKVLLAVSGGADSTALLYAMCALKTEGVFSGDFACAHINHQLRGTQAQADEDFVIAQAHSLKLAITTRRLDVRGFARKSKLSIETAARKLRIESLLDIAKASNCNWIATAHHKNDNAETVLQRLGRGTGFRGLGGIWPMKVFADNIRYARPLLCVSRDEITGYLKEQNLKWRTDLTNEDCRYRRNYIRHRLLPELQKECNGSIVEQLFDLSQQAQRFYRLVCSSVEKVWPEVAERAGDNLKLDLKSFSNQPKPVKVELIRQSLAAIGSGERDLTQGHYGSILQLSEQNISGRRMELPGGFVVWREYGDLIFARTKRTAKPHGRISESTTLEVPGQTRFGQYSIETTILDSEQIEAERFKAEKTEFVECFDLARVSLPLVARFRQAGDRFWPLGLAGEKKVGKFLTAAKVPQEVRKRVIVIADSEKIIWLWPIRISEQAKVTGETQKIIQLRITTEYPERRIKE